MQSNKKRYCLLLFYLFLHGTISAGGFTIKYFKPANPKHQKLYKALLTNNDSFFGDAVEFLNNLYVIPTDVQIIVADCGSRNSRYNLNKGTIYICYETLQFKINDYRNPPKNKEAYLSRVFKNSVFTFWHEVGHAMIHQLKLPSLHMKLKEEDLADEFAVLSMIWREDIKWTNSLVTSSLHYKNRMLWLRNQGMKEKKYERHSPDSQRYYRITCLLYGAKPVTFKRLEQKLKDNPNEPGYCKLYYRQRDEYWSKKLRAYTKYNYFK